jgi:hypothetical protein
MPKEKKDRKASSPAVGGMRDAVRTIVAFGVAAGLAFAASKMGLVEGQIDLAGIGEGITVVIVSAIMAFMGKAFRNNGQAVGKVL